MRGVPGTVKSSTRPGPAARGLRPGTRLCRVIAFALLAFLSLGGSAIAAPSTTVTFTFDDGRPSQMAAAQELANRGMKATFFIISSEVGQPGVMTVSDLNTLEASGMEIGAHTVLHRNLPSLSSGEAMRELCLSRNWLLDRGFDIYGMAYPYDATNASVKQAAAACGYNSARSGGQLQCDSGHACAETVPPLDPYALRTPNAFEVSTTLAQMKAMVTNAENNGGGWVPLELHDVCNGPNDPLLPPGAPCTAPGYITRALYTQFLNWLQGEVTAGRVQVKTVHEVVGGGLAPKVAVAPAPVREGNMLLNPSFEQAATGGQASDCWGNLSNGPGHPPAITTTSDAHNGSKALAIGVPAAYESWAYNLIAPALDLAQCSPTALPGHNYTFTGWYKGNGQIKVVAHWRNADHRWARLDWGAAGTKTFPAAAAWTKAAFTFVAPSAATAVSAGFYIDGGSANHNYTIDDTGLVDDGFQLTVARTGTGNGSVTSGPAGIACGATCQAAFRAGTTVTLAAAAAPGSSFSGWSGACSGSSATCTVPMSAARSATATFTVDAALAVVTAGTGEGTVTSSPAGIDCGTTCETDLDNGATVALTAVATPGSAFAGWSGACSGAAATCALVMTTDRTAIAVFTIAASEPAPTIQESVAPLAQAPAAPAASPPARVRAAGVKARPALRARPSIGGRPRAGRTLVCTRGTWSGSPSRYVFTWRRDGKPVVGHASAFHVRTADRGHILRCFVTARNAMGFATAASGSVRVPHQR
jgi:peptidoglycan/xylan/chitin deacetylase (PgdA/CDA1 family)